MPLTEKITNVVHTYLSSFEKKDIDAIMNLYADECWIEDPVGSERKAGREEIRELYKIGLSMSVKITLESEIRIAGNEAAFAFRLEADTPDGTMTVRPIDVMVFDDEGKVTSMRAFWGPTNQRVES